MHNRAGWPNWGGAFDLPLHPTLADIESALMMAEAAFYPGNLTAETEKWLTRAKLMMARYELDLAGQEVDLYPWKKGDDR